VGGPTNSPFLALDVGGSRIKSATIVDGEAEEHPREPVAHGVGELVSQIVDLYERAGEGARLPWGLCMAGLVDADRGTVGYSVNLGLRDVPMLELLEAKLPRPRVFENDLVAAVAGEADGGTLALMQIGTGIAGRYAVDGAVVSSAGGHAGEIGHLRFRPDGRPCACGNRGCAEAYGGWGAVRRRYEEARRPVSSPAALLREAEVDPWAREVLDDALEAIGFAAAALVATWDPGTLRVGGGVAAAWGDTLHAAIRRALEAQVLPELAASTRVEASRLGERASLLGLFALSCGSKRA
jgi:glucokinase